MTLHNSPYHLKITHGQSASDATPGSPGVTFLHPMSSWQIHFEGVIPTQPLFRRREGSRTHI
jgi:hypothetical protein